MIRKICIAVLLASSILFTFGCTPSVEPTSSGDQSEVASGPAEEITITMLHFKVDEAAAIEALCEKYEEENANIKFEVEAVGGSGDYEGTLMARFSSKEAPDIWFNNGGENELDKWGEKLTDLSNEPWVSDALGTAVEGMTRDGKLYGMPINIEGYGYIYNKDLFDEAGITELPTTLSELEATAKKLKDAGILPFINAYKEQWVLADHLLNAGLSKLSDPAVTVTALGKGEQKFKGNAVFEQWIDLIDLTVKYGNENMLTTDYNTLLNEFAAGNGAMVQQGNWIQATIDQLNPDMRMGILPMPISDDRDINNRLLVGVPGYWVITNTSDNIDEGKAFLNWMVSSEFGKNHIVKEFKFIPAFTNITFEAEDLGDIASGILEFTKDNKTLGWYRTRLPSGYESDVAASIQKYLAKQINREQMLEEFDTHMANLNK